MKVYDFYIFIIIDFYISLSSYLSYCRYFIYYHIFIRFSINSNNSKYFDFSLNFTKRSCPLRFPPYLYHKIADFRGAYQWPMTLQIMIVRYNLGKIFRIVPKDYLLIYDNIISIYL